MSKILITAEDVLMIYGPSNTIEAMKEFAKLHVQAALEAASNEARFCNKDEPDYDYDNQVISHQSILNSYPLENIK